MKTYEVLFYFKRILLDDYSDRANPYVNRAYANVISKIKESYAADENINKHDISILNITPNMKNKLYNILIKKISDKDKKELKKSYLMNELNSIAGIGEKKAAELIDAGLNSIKQLTYKKWEKYLSTGIILILKNKPLRRIPYEYIKKLEPKLVTGKNIKIVGGFIRRKPFSKDIDIMIISNKNTIPDYIEYLRKQFSEVHVYVQGSGKASLIIKNNDDYLKIDIFITPTIYKHAMLLYAIGSKQFNIKMRSIAKRKGFMLNQYGLFPLDARGVVEKNTGPVGVNSERDFFTILGMPYVMPYNR